MPSPFAASVLLAAAFLLGAASCASSPGAPQAPVLVPEEALAVAYIADPRAFLASVEAGWKAGDFTKLAGSDPRSLLEGMNGLVKEFEAVVDPGRPWAAYVLYAETQTRPSLFVALPYAGDPAKVLASLAEEGIQEVARASGYLLLSNESSPRAFPPERGADLSPLLRFPKASLAFWVDGTRLGQIGSMLGSEPAETALEEEGSEDFLPYSPSISDRFRAMALGAGGSSDEAYSGPAYSSFQDAFRPLTADFLAGDTDEDSDYDYEDLSNSDPESPAEPDWLENAEKFFTGFDLGLTGISAALVPGRAGLALRLALSFRPESDLGRLVAAEATVPSALPWTRRLPAEAVFTSSFAGNGEARRVVREIYPSLLEAFSTFLGESDPSLSGVVDQLQASLKAAEDPIYSALGERGAMWIDLDPGAFGAAIAAAEKGDLRGVGDLVPEFGMVYEARDGARLDSYLAGIPEHPAVKEVLDALEAAATIRIGLSGSRRVENGFGYGELVPALQGRPANPDEGPVWDALLGAFRMRWATGPGGLAVGNFGVAELKATSEGRVQGPSLAVDPRFQALAPYVPAGSQFVMTLSLRRLALLAKSLEELGLGGYSYDPPNLGLAAFWFASDLGGASPRAAESRPTFEFGYYLDSGTLGELYRTLDEEAQE